jgi:dedicated sortase system histidine kinase
MRLRAQLLVVSLLTLALPWAGCQYVREVERAQRQGIGDALLDGAAIVASSLATRPDLLYPSTELRTAVRDDTADIYATRIATAPVLDGYADDWVERGRTTVAPSTSYDTLRVEYTAAVDPRYLNLFLDVHDEAIAWLDPSIGDGAPHDRVLVALEAPDGHVQRYVFATAAPGPLNATDAATGTASNRVRGYWQSVAGGYQLELRLPLSLLGARFGFSVLDADDGGDVASAGTLRDPGTASPAAGLLVYAPETLAPSLEAYRQAGKRLRVADKAGFELASIGELDSLDASDPDAGGAVDEGLLALLYRSVLAGEDTGDVRAARGLPTAPGVQSALAGRPATTWYRLADSRRAIVAAAQPVLSGSELLGAVVIEQADEATLTVADRALVRLVNATLLASLCAAAALLAYATWLSVRIRRLRDAAGRALDSRGRIAAQMPGVGARDEVGDLARGFTTLLERLREHTDYLKTLADKLSHELRTPLAVVQSSLENLAHHELDEQTSVYAGRARDGVARLRAILSAMSEATRVEQSLQGAQLEDFDLAALVRASAAAYRDAYPARRVEWSVPDEACPLRGTPELIVQMLDKLVENAVDFTPSQGRIELSLAGTPEAWRLAVANEGPPLPQRMHGNIFDSLVSVRDQRGERPHLGLGLHIARLIAESHGGSIEARDLADARGAEFIVNLPRTRP